MTAINVDPMRVAKALENKMREMGVKIGETEAQNAVLTAALEEAHETIEALQLQVKEASAHSHKHYDDAAFDTCIDDAEDEDDS